MHTFDLNLSNISKIEGKASLTVKVKDDRIEECKFKITEFKRFYTQALRGKDVVGMPQLSCRICGTCSNAHLLCAIAAAENALGIVPSDQTRLLRKLVNYGLIIRDHGLHLYVFALPDILGIDNILELDEHDPRQHQLLDDTFTVKAAGNTLGSTIGGRSVHAPYPAVAGFTRLPDASKFPQLIKQLTEARPAVLRLIKVFADCPFVLEQAVDFVALMDGEYSFLEGDVIDSQGRKISQSDFGNYLEHVVVPYSHASGYKFGGSLHLVGALARVNLARDKLHPRTLADAAAALSVFPSKNIYHNNLAQAIEVLHAIDRSLDILKNLKLTEEKISPPAHKAGVGVGIIEAPRGTLFYKVALDTKGIITNIQIVVPTGQNQIGIEKSIYDYLQKNLDKDKDTLVHEAEKIVRAYDPCMSCASHFLKVRWQQE